MHWDLLLERQTVKRLSANDVRTQLLEIREAVERNQTYGFQARLGKLREPAEVYVDNKTTPENRRWLYRVKLRAAKPRWRSEEAAHRQFAAMLQSLMRTAHARGWRVIHPESNEEIKLEPAMATESNGVQIDGGLVNTADQRPEFVVPELTPETKKAFFSGIYDRDDHIDIAHAAMKAFVDRKGEEPSHILFYGPPAGAKTKLFRGLKGFYEQDGCERVVIIDATTLTKAGLETWLMQRASTGMLPKLLVLEEGEKHQKENLLSLLSVMASGEVMRTNARQGQPRAETKILVGMTCNDEEELKRFHKGALWSRFVHQLYCPRPNRDRMYEILLDKIVAMNGDSAWAKACLDYAYNEVGNDDPRFISGLLDGKDGLLDGTYLEKHRRIRTARIQDLERRGLLEKKKLDDAVATVRRSMQLDRLGTMNMLGLDETRNFG